MAHYRGRDNINERVVKTERLFLERPRSFVFQFRALDLRISGDEMTNVDFQSNGGDDIVFDFGGSTYTMVKADIVIVRRLRSRKFSLEPSTVAIV